MIERKFLRTRRATQPIAVAVLLLLPSLLCAGNAIHDLFVFYSIGTAERYGEKLPTMIQQAVAEANQVYANAGVAITLRLVGTAPSPIADANGIEATLHAS